MLVAQLIDDLPFLLLIGAVTIVLGLTGLWQVNETIKAGGKRASTSGAFPIPPDAPTWLLRPLAGALLGIGIIVFACVGRFDPSLNNYRVFALVAFLPVALFLIAFAGVGILKTDSEKSVQPTGPPRWAVAAMIMAAGAIFAAIYLTIKFH